MLSRVRLRGLVALTSGSSSELTHPVKTVVISQEDPTIGSRDRASASSSSFTAKKIPVTELVDYSKALNDTTERKLPCLIFSVL